MKYNLAVTCALLVVIAAFTGCARNADPTTGPLPDSDRIGLLEASNTSVSVFDPASDHRDDPLVDPDPDMISGFVECNSEWFFLGVHFYEPSFDPDTAVVDVVIDIDQDPGTGYPGVDAGTSDDALIGAEYVAGLNHVLGRTTLYRFEPPDYSAPPTVVGEYPLISITGGYIGAVSRSDLVDDGAFNFKMTTFARLSVGGYSGVIDVMPDVGEAPGTAEACPRELTLNLRPDGTSPPINCRNRHGLITMILPGSADFDVADVDHASVRFAGAGEWHVNRRTGEVRRHENGGGDDAYPDIIFHFRLEDTSLDCSSTEAELTGLFWDGTPFSATVMVTMNDPSREEATGGSTP